MKNTGILSVTCMLIFLVACNNSEKEIDDLVNDRADWYDLKPIGSSVIAMELNFAEGCNSATLEVQTSGVEYKGVDDSAEVMADALGSEGYTEIHWADKKTSLKRVLDITDEVDLNFNIYGWDSENEYRKNIYKETQNNSYHGQIAITASYINTAKVLKKKVLTETAKKLAKDDPDAFMRKYGDCFVYGIYTGGKMYCLFDVDTRTDYEKKVVKTFFESNNSYGEPYKLRASRNTIKTLIDSVVKRKKSFRLFKKGGKGYNNDFQIDSLAQYALEYANSISPEEKAQILYLELRQYETIEDFPEMDFSKIRIAQRGFIKEALGYRDKLTASLDNIEFLSKNPNYFDETAKSYSLSIKDSISDRLDKLNRVLSQCQDDFDECNSKKLDEFLNTVVYTPQMEFPYFNGKGKNLPITPEAGYKILYENTGPDVANKWIVISGQLKSQERRNTEVVSCKDPIFKGEISYMGNKKIVRWKHGKRRRWSKPIYLHDFNPYYQLRFTNPKTGHILRSKNWTGEPIKAEHNQRIEVRLVNPVSYAQYNWRGHKNIDYSNISNLPKYNGFEDCNPGRPPKISIVSIDSLKYSGPNELIKTFQ